MTKYSALTIACVMAGIGFYKMDNDIVPAIAFTLGMLGIILSVLRRSGSHTKEK
jgi:hypothetical protein